MCPRTFPIPFVVLVLLLTGWNMSQAANLFYWNDQETEVTYSGGTRSAEFVYDGSWAEKFTGDNSVHELIRLDESSRLPELPAGTRFTSFVYEVQVSDREDPSQTYKIGVRFAKNDGTWIESDYFETADTGIDDANEWQTFRYDITELVNQQVAAGYTHIGRINIRAYNTGEYSDYYIDDVLLEYEIGQAQGDPPQITSHPASLVRNVGQTATFTVVATGTDPLAYQWYRNDTLISGATAATYTTPSLTVDADNSRYHCVVSNEYGSVASNAAVLRVVPQPPEDRRGDLDGNGSVDLADTIPGLQAMSGQPTPAIHVEGDADGDGRIGLAEVVYSLQTAARTSQPAQYSVLVGSQASEGEQFAADELVRYLEEANVQVRRTTAYDASAGPYIVVGVHNDYVTDPPDPAQVGEDGFVFRREGQNLVIAGATDRGTLYGVYQYLRELVGYEWYALDTVSVPRFADGAAPPMPAESRIVVPRFRYRGVFNPEAGEPIDSDGPNPDADFAARIQLNGQLGHKTDYLYENNGEESYHRGLLRTRHGFGINTGNDAISFNVGDNPATADATFNDAVAHLRNGGRYRQVENQTGLWYPKISHIDGGSRSHDPADEALVAANGGAAGAPLMYLTGRVADALRNEFPEAVFLGEAYLWSLQPPTSITLPANAGVAFAPIEADWAQPLDGDHNTTLFNYLQEWTNHTDHIWTWLYTTNFSGYLQPLPTIYPMIGTIRRLAGIQDVEGIFLQDSYSSRGGSFAALHTWLYSRLMWDPTLDGDQLVRQFCNGYYGPDAGPLIYRYIQDLHESIRQHPSRIDTKTGPGLPYLNAAFVIGADQLMEQAEAAAAGNALYLKHVRIERMGVDWVILLNGARLSLEAQQQGLTWPDATEEERLARVDRFTDTVRNVAAMESFGEGTGDLNDMLASFRYPRVVPSTPVLCTGGGCIEYEDFNFRLAEAQLVHDELASDHGAARMVGSTPVWGVQVPFQMLLPETGQWDIYADVRVDPGVDVDGDAVALRLGVDPTPHGRDIPLKALADGRYHTLRITGSPYAFDAEKYLWFAPPASDAIQYMYVDRVYAVPAGTSALENRCPAGTEYQGCRLLGEFGLQLFMEMSSWVEDSRAENGWAAYLHGGFHEWGIQANLAGILPESGQWDVYAAVRLDRLGPVDDSAVAFALGVEGAGSTNVTVGELADGNYHLLRLPGGPFTGGDSAGIYFWPDNAAIALYVDYLLAVPVVSGEDVTPAMASAFLARATYGPRMEEIEALAGSDDLEGWIDEQFSKPPCYHLDWMKASTPASQEEWDNGLAGRNWARRDAWWHCSVDGEDQLRQRVAFALSEIFVVSERSELVDKDDGLARYYDLLVEHSFGNFRELLRAVARSPMMGIYLSYLGNRKASGNVHPDENFAREVMQLFTIGLYELNQDGTRKLRDGRPIPTYSQQDITAMARVFTGWSSDNGISDPAAGLATLYIRTAPMVAFPEDHDTGAKTVLGHTIPASQTTEQDLDSVVEILTGHPNTGPFIARRLIQRLVTSNPTPAYIDRVAAAFNDNGHGVRGDMKAVIKAILLDPEALHGARDSPETFGKLREPLLFLTHLWRTFHAREGLHAEGDFSYTSFGYRDSAGSIPQQVLSAPTVFNFFTPDDRPADLVDAAGNPLYAPEMTILPYVAIQDMVLYCIFERGEYEVDGMTASLSLDEEARLVENGDYDGLLERLDILLMGGQMGDDLRQMLRQHIDYDLGVPITDAQFIVRDLIGLVMVSPQYAVQR